MAKKSALTGHQKKLERTMARVGRHGEKYLEEAYEQLYGFRPGGRHIESLKHQLEKPLKAYDRYLPTSKHPYKELERFLPGGKAYKSPDFYKESKEGLKLAQRAMEPIEKEAIMKYRQESLPAIYGQFGREAGAGSSALNQALAASAANLQATLGSQLGQLAVGYGQNISQMNLAERARQQALQYGAASDIFNLQRGAALGLAEQQRGDIGYLRDLQMAALGQLSQAGLAPASLSLGTNPYIPSGTQGPSGGSRFAAAALPIAGAAIGSLFGPAGSLAGAKLGAGIGGAAGAAILR